MPIYLLPVAGLRPSIDLDLAIGRVRMLGPDRAKAYLRGAADPALLPEMRRLDFEEFEAELASCVAALVEAEDKDGAVDLVETALDVVRVFLSTRSLSQMPSFGLTDGVLAGAVRYADLDAGGIGWFRIGHVTGVHLTEATVQAYVASDFAHLAGAAVGASKADASQTRALTAVRLGSQALLTHDSATRVVLAMTAAEVLLFGPREKSTSYRLAQRSAFLLCGRPNGELCGRSRDSCLILKADLGGGDLGYKQLRKVRDLSAVDLRWRCSQWLDVLGWYDIRSDVVHKGGTVDRGDASRVTFWLVNRLLPTTLRWYATNSIEPHLAIESALRALPQPPRWQLDYAKAHEQLATDGASDVPPKRGASRP